jgi:phenylpropionate dioxygenase-like ring-hydroxylating dioxygenase large terminal subunit
MISFDDGGSPEAVEPPTGGVLHVESSTGPFDYCPKLGFREYWYPALRESEVKARPIRLTMLGEELVFFRDGHNRVAALSDWCPHRGARLSMGRCEFPGTVTCPYHGYTFDGSGQCIAGLIESPNSHFITKLRARKFPTAERLGIVFVWMGETDPVPVEQDIPHELLDCEFTGTRFMRVKVWGANWTEPVAQGIDFHEFYLHHPRPSVWRIVNVRLPFFRPRVIYTGGVRIVSAGPDHVEARMADEHREQTFYPGLNAKWPRKTSFWIFPWDGYRGTPGVGRPLVDWDHNAELPSKIRTIIGQSIHLRWMVPISEDETRVWTFTLVRLPKTWLRSVWQALWYHCYRKPAILIDTNEKEDLVVFAKGNLNLDRPQKLGPLDAALMYFRRNLALRSRDFQRLGGAHGCVRRPPQASKPAPSLPSLASGVEREGAPTGR